MIKTTEKIQIELSALEVKLLVDLIRTEKKKIARSGKAPNAETSFLYSEMSKLYTKLNK